MRLVVALLALTGCACSSVAGQRPPSPDTTTIQGLRVLAESGDHSPGDSLAFVLDFQSVRGPDGESLASPEFGEDCDRRLERWDGVGWALVPDELWRLGELVRQDHRPDVAAIVCRDSAVQFRPGVSASRRFPYRLSGDAEPGWYRWCLTVGAGTRWLCSEAVPVGRSVRRVG